MTAAACGTCGTAALRDDAKFCDECGAPIAQARKPAEFQLGHYYLAQPLRTHSRRNIHRMDHIGEQHRHLLGSTAHRPSFSATAARWTNSPAYGFMPILGAPTALEDHAFRACLAALDIQNETELLAAEVQRCDGIALQLRVGLNSGQVIAGEIGSGPTRYTAIGEEAGMAQSMESVAPPGGVMLSESTMRLIENAAEPGDPEAVDIKGSDYPVRGRRLLMWQRNGERAGGTSRP